MIYRMNTFTYQGGCHCGKIRYEFSLPNAIENTEILSCNCNICEKLGYLHLLIPKNRFSLIGNDKDLTNYQFNKKIAKHLFCKNCGIKSFYQPRSHPKNWSINARCLDDFAKINISATNFDGKNWEQNIKFITK